MEDGENFNSMEPTKKQWIFYNEKEKEAKSKRRSLSGTQKAEICHLKEQGISQVAIAKQFHISEATVSKIVCAKVRWLSLDLNTNKAIMK